MIKISDPHWFEGKAVQMRIAGRRPRTLREWARCAWNADFFFGPVPYFKTVLAGNILVWVVK